MKHISILVLQDAVLSSIDATRQLFTRVNDFSVMQGKSPVCEIHLVGVSKDTAINDGAYTIHCDQLIQDVEQTDLIIIPMICGNFANIIAANKAFAPWVIKQYKHNAEIGCLCSGSFFLASTGLLNGKACATHWAAANEFRKMFPAVKVVDDKIITYEQGIYTSGGSFSYLNLLLYLIEKNAGREMSVLVSKMFEIEIERKSQASFSIFIGQKDHEDEPIKEAQEFIENNYCEKITIDQLTSMLALSRRNFERRFKKATLNTVVEYIQRVRVEAVKKGLESSRKTIIDLMYDVGYSDVKAFRTTFKKVTGLSPVEYRNKYCDN
ncbi:transcriptional regulator GlxA family with amidase domain [Chitinophaga niastensis]|uniref:Transcriptional regulator GlxA family with amidase domain n=1 Tax=Chitinophaga niastensis TaxID=536980 RepID=A0A2P8HCC2_CHINA|nr:helix-turn-helix domain-containing protein [Chitinophaga niastensis]PSL43854.1 transcriptional regulator GlxA family with amidase domain [Chitinophaga niastensis]